MEPLPRPRRTHPWGDEPTPYAAIGGAEAVRSLVDSFYDRISAESPNLRAMLPRDDSGSREKLFEFMSGWLGGPDLYAAKRGHPKLRMRHLPFAIGIAEAEEWMRCMRLAMDDSEVLGDVAEFLDARLDGLAKHMVNR